MTLAEAKKKIEDVLQAHLVAEPPMVIIKGGKRTPWSGFRLIRRGEATMMITTQELQLVARSKRPEEVIAKMVRARGGATVV